MPIKDQIAEQAERAKGKIFEMGRKAGEQTASALETGAAGLDKRAAGASRLVHKTAGGLQTAADYIREHDAKGMMDSIKDFVRHHPWSSLAAAVIAGFLLGRGFQHSA